MTILLTDQYTEAPKARAIPGAIYSKEQHGWILHDPTPRGAAVALRLFPTLASSNPELVELRASLSQEIRPFDRATQYDTPIQAMRVRGALAPEGHALYGFQELDLGYLAAVLRQHGSAYLGWERGLGKTLGACALLDELRVGRALVVSPNTAKRAVWEPELQRFCPWLEVVVLRNAKNQRLSDLNYCRQLKAINRPFVLVVHYEALDIELAALNKLGEWDIVIADEVHRIGNPKTKMARALKKIKTQYKLGLSGSIIQNHAEELFSPLQWMYPKHYSSKWRDWNDRFLDYVDGGYSKVCIGVKIEQLENMRDELGVFMTYRRKEDELDLPERIEETRFVELSPQQRVAYDQLREEYATQLDDGTHVKATDGLVLLTRLRQVATGLDLLGRDVTDSSKLDIAVELIEDNPDEAFVVFSWYKAAAYSLSARLEQRGVRNYVVTGDTKHDDRATYIQEFQRGEGRVFIGTLSTLGESVTLHRASNAIFLDRSWNPGTNAQAADRIYRIGQEKSVVITHLVARDTVDELRVMPTVADKEALRNLILGVN